MLPRVNSCVIESGSMVSAITRRDVDTSAVRPGFLAWLMGPTSSYCRITCIRMHNFYQCLICSPSPLLHHLSFYFVLRLVNFYWFIPSQLTKRRYNNRGRWILCRFVQLQFLIPFVFPNSHILLKPYVYFILGSRHIVKHKHDTRSQLDAYCYPSPIWNICGKWTTSNAAVGRSLCDSLNHWTLWRNSSTLWIKGATLDVCRAPVTMSAWRIQERARSIASPSEMLACLIGQTAQANMIRIYKPHSAILRESLVSSFQLPLMDDVLLRSCN